MMEVSMLLSGADNGAHLTVKKAHHKLNPAWSYHIITDSFCSQQVSIFSIIYQNLNNSIELFNSFEGRGGVCQKQGVSECNSVHEHLVIIYKKRIIKLSQKKVRPPLGVALLRCERLGCSLLSPFLVTLWQRLLPATPPSLSAAAWGMG
jgi:hypothetical protein